MELAKKDIYKVSRIGYIAVSALEYFISIMVSTNYLAYLAGAIGIDDGTVGVLTSFVSLGCGFQIFALFMRQGKPVKRFVLFTNIANQLCFAFLYLVPFIEVSISVKTVIFIIALLAGHILMNIVFSPRANWFRGLIPPDRLGRFSVTSEMVSLFGGMAFTFGLGALADHYKAIGDLRTFFIIGAIGLFGLMVLNTASTLLIKEKHDIPITNVKLSKQLKEALTDKATLLLIPVFVLWNFAYYGTTSFFPAYAQNDLGFTMTTLSLMSAIYAIVRVVTSFPLAQIGDKRSFATMMSLGMIAFTIGLGVNAFGGKVCYWIYYMLYAVTLAGTNSGKMNLIFTYVSPDKRTGALSILYTIGGFVGFLSSLAMKPLYNHVNATHSFLGIENVYGAQVISVVGIIITIIGILYLNLVVRRIRRPHADLKTDDAA